MRALRAPPPPAGEYPPGEVHADPARVNGIYLHAVVQGIRVSREFQAVGFRNHPKFYPEVVMHLFNTYVPRSVFDLRLGTNKSDAMRLKITELEGSVATVDRDCKKVAADHRLLKRDHDSLASRVSSVADKCGVKLPKAKKGKQARGQGDDEEEI